MKRYKSNENSVLIMDRTITFFNYSKLNGYWSCPDTDVLGFKLKQFLFFPVTTNNKMNDDFGCQTFFLEIKFLTIIISPPLQIPYSWEKIKQVFTFIDSFSR